MKAYKILITFALFLVSALCFNSIISAAGVTVAGLIFTAPGGIGTPFAWNMNYLPQFLTFNNVVPLTSLRVETQEDGILHDWVAASIAVVNGYMTLGAQAANIVVLRLANGHLKSKNVTISGVTSAAGAVAFFEASDQLGTYPFKTVNAAIIANNPTTFENFTAVFAPTMAAGDTCQIDYRDGHRQTYMINDLAALSSYYQEVPQIMVNNVNSYIKRAQFTCAANTAAYVMSVKL